MALAFGKEQITIGSAPDCDVVIAAHGVAPRHALVVKRSGQLSFVDLGAGASTANGAQLAPQQPVPFDFRTVFTVGGVPVPLAHAAICSLLMSPGQLQPPRGQVVVGRDAARSSLVLSQGAVSGQHATVMLDRMMVVDHGSTSGTWVGGQQIPPNQPTPIDPNGVVAFGPVPVPVVLLAHVAQGGLAGVPAAAPAVQPPTAQLNQLSASQAGLEGGGGPAPRKHRTVIGELKLDDLASNVITIGRTPDNQIVVNHPQVSSKHAQIVKAGDQLFLEDRGSANGTYVRGQRLPSGQRAPVANGEKVFIGPMPLLIHIAESRVNVVVEDQANWAGKPLYEIEAWDLYLEVPDRDDKSQMKVLLDHVSFKALPGDMIALMGPSGAGKTTLLLALNGYLPPTSGQVRINGEDLYTIYDALRGSIGYVPQDDIVHPELTVFEAVKYSARFRLPPDYSEDEIDRRVDDTLRDLGLEAVRNLQIGKPEKKVLSGGQRKRVNIALELVTDPVILFLDEPTSGLAADDTTALISLLADLTKKTGKTIVMTIHQPAKDEFEKFNLGFIMGYGGIPTYFGPTGDAAYSFFATIQSRSGAAGKRIDNPRDMFDMLNARERLVLDELKRSNPAALRQEARLAASRAWREEFLRSPLFQQMYSGRRAIGTAPAARGVPHRADVAVIRQLGLLLSRYWRVKLRDRMGAAIMFLQAPIIGVLLWLVFGGQTAGVPYWCLGALQELSKKNSMDQSATTNLLNTMQPTTDHTAAMFFVVVSCVWFGTSNAAREIVTERAIYMRERMVNLRLLNYVLSKFILLSFFCVLQCAMLLGIVFFALGFNGGPLAFAYELGNLVALAVNATALGLCVSTMVSSAEAAMALTPIALIPQVVLGGLMVPMTTNPNLRPLMYVMPSRWGFEGAIASERMAIANDVAWNIDLHKPDLTSLPDFVQNGRFQCAIAQVASDSINGAWGFTEWDQIWLPSAVLCGMTLAMLVVLLVALKRRDPV
ncbi:MAG TPA: FHA domain-containing protein [Polyangiaceae bacterium]|jgi:ABC-type multidrug transport system ATPase subunit/pSer/pThr/pTyr-binding forkhead associated (FHA) protein